MVVSPGADDIVKMLATILTLSEPIGVVGVPTPDSRTYTITASSPPNIRYSNVSNDDDFTTLHLVLDVRMAEIGQRLGMNTLCNQAAFNLANRCHKMDFSSVQDVFDVCAALREVDGLDHDNRLFRELLAFAQKDYAKLFSKIPVTDCLRDAPRLMGKIIDHQFNKHVLLVDRSTKREIDTSMEFRCPQCHGRFHAELVGVATWCPCRLCGFAAADTGYWKEHYSLP